MLGMMAAMLAAGCAPESGTTEPPAAEAREVVTAFTRAFAFSTHAVGESTFVVPAHGSVMVTAHAIWSRRAACALPTFDIELVAADPPASAGAQAYPTTGATNAHVWTNLEDGTYHLVFDSANDDAACRLGGAVRVVVKP
jgi:hypothetical protein